jgi:hypothetical protein
MMRRERRLYRVAAIARSHTRERGRIQARPVEPPKLGRDCADKLRERWRG